MVALVILVAEAVVEVVLMFNEQAVSIHNSYNDDNGMPGNGGDTIQLYGETMAGGWWER